MASHALVHCSAPLTHMEDVLGGKFALTRRPQKLVCIRFFNIYFNSAHYSAAPWLYIRESLECEPLFQVQAKTRQMNVILDEATSAL